MKKIQFFWWLASRFLTNVGPSCCDLCMSICEFPLNLASIRNRVSCRTSTNGYWDLLFFNTEKSTFCNISTRLEPDRQERESRLQFFSKFIESYNELSHKHKLRPFEYWKHTICIQKRQSQILMTQLFRFYITSINWILRQPLKNLIQQSSEIHFKKKYSSIPKTWKTAA